MLSFRSSIFDPRSSILDPRSLILDLRSSILDPRSSILDPRSSMAVRMRMLLVMLPEQVVSVVVSIRSSDDGVDVLPIHLSRVRSKAAQANRQLVIEFDQDHRTLDAVIEDVVRPRPADPGEARVVNALPDFVHLNPGVSVTHISDVLPDQVEQLFFLFRRKFRGANAGVIKNDVVLES